MGIHDDYLTAPNLNILMGCMLAQLMICYIMEVKLVTSLVRCILRDVHTFARVYYNLPTPILFARQLETNGARLLCFFNLSILRNGTPNSVKAPSAINQSFRLDKKLHHVKIPDS